MIHWTGDYAFLLRELILKDFKIRYRNMSLGLFWSLLNPLIMMAVWTYVFTHIFSSRIPHFSVHLLSAVISFNFFTSCWVSATSSVVDNTAFVKRVPMRREIFPIAAVLSNVTHLLIQFLLLLVFVVLAGLGMHWSWLWLIVVWALELVFLVGLGLVSAALNVFVRDTRYLVESINTVMFWLVPIIYSFDMVPAGARDLYQYNPIAALVLATHNVILDGRAPSLTLVTKLAFVAFSALIIGTEFFRRAERRFYEYL